MAWSAFDQEANEQAYNDLVKRNQWGRSANKLSSMARKGGIVDKTSDIPGIVDAAMKLLPGILTAELERYTDEHGNLIIAVEDK